MKIASSNAGKEFAAEEISAQVLRKLVDDASKFLNDKVSRSACCPASLHHHCTGLSLPVLCMRSYLLLCLRRTSTAFPQI